jgi:hypothetical protein
VKNVLPYWSSLRSLNLGEDTGLGLTNWHIDLIFKTNKKRILDLSRKSRYVVVSIRNFITDA